MKPLQTSYFKQLQNPRYISSAHLSPLVLSATEYCDAEQGGLGVAAVLTSRSALSGHPTASIEHLSILAHILYVLISAAHISARSQLSICSSPPAPTHPTQENDRCARFRVQQHSKIEELILRFMCYGAAAVTSIAPGHSPGESIAGNALPAYRDHPFTVWPKNSQALGNRSTKADISPGGVVTHCHVQVRRPSSVLVLRC